jgi:hypothetical protein
MTLNRQVDNYLENLRVIRLWCFDSLSDRVSLNSIPLGDLMKRHAIGEIHSPYPSNHFPSNHLFLLPEM